MSGVICVMRVRSASRRHEICSRNSQVARVALFPANLMPGTNYVSEKLDFTFYREAEEGNKIKNI